FLQQNPSDARAPKAYYGRGVSLVRLGQDRAGVSGIRETVGDTFQDDDASPILAAADKRNPAPVIRLGSACVRGILLQKGGIRRQRFAIAILLEARIAGVE